MRTGYGLTEPGVPNGRAVHLSPRATYQISGQFDPRFQAYFYKKTLYRNTRNEEVFPTCVTCDGGHKCRQCDGREPERDEHGQPRTCAGAHTRHVCCLWGRCGAVQHRSGLAFPLPVGKLRGNYVHIRIGSDLKTS